ncbi:hypothetical protein FXF61_05845 [Pseudomonas sp. C27(2019)]|uniref:hypothetical protein n=1 Tax=Pseudomonas sp. C27(2019) TaxID=2604941 RepID=UPI0012487D85|nr:hypothetical protein [Pseudomonas sp. C27(2019)]QEY58719.1 hypothetical protein FXF61_05845 [Pseudomonas sp. C27(2019)]
MTVQPNKDDPVALRKQLIQMRLELNRQKVRHEAMVLVEPVHKIRTYQKRLLQGSNPLLLVAGVTVASFFIARKRSSASNLLSVMRMASSLLPLFVAPSGSADSAAVPADSRKKRTTP